MSVPTTSEMLAMSHLLLAASSETPLVSVDPAALRRVLAVAEEYRQERDAMKAENERLRALLTPTLGDPIVETGESGMRGERGRIVPSASSPGELSILWSESSRMPAGLQTGITHGAVVDVSAMRAEIERLLQASR